ncbi:MAG: MgtC/SapB family protein [Chloroflexia bacterium]|nr:MgtC/SapB family protein [Chloroflexia bacterium]
MMGQLTDWEGLIRVALAAVLGGIIGIERELRAKDAGLRTNMLVAMGAALFTVSSIQLSEFYINWNGSIRFDPSRIISTIVSGIGFLGGAIIFKTEERVRGVTTAASIWVVTGVGVATGAGFYVMAAGSTVLIVVVLLMVGWIEHRVGFKKGPVLPEVEDD